MVCISPCKPSPFIGEGNGNYCCKLALIGHNASWQCKLALIGHQKLPMQVGIDWTANTATVIDNTLR